MPTAYTWVDVAKGQVAAPDAINALGNTVEAHDVKLVGVGTGSVGFTPVWGASGTAPVLGTGALDGEWRTIGNSLAWVFIRLTWGSSTTPGTGAWTFTLPTPPFHSTDMLPCMIDDISVPATYSAKAVIFTSGIGRIGLQGGTLVGAGVPITWATGDTLLIEGIMSITIPSS